MNNAYRHYNDGCRFLYASFFMAQSFMWPMMDAVSCSDVKFFP